MAGHPVAMGHTMLGPNGMVSHMVPSQDYHHAGASPAPTGPACCLLLKKDIYKVYIITRRNINIISIKYIHKYYKEL